MEPFRILVVDDEIDFLETIVNRLRKRRFHAEGVQTGEEALEFLKRGSVDVVLLDVKMPGGMDGIDVLRAIKKEQPSTQVILLTGHASVETSIEGMQHGAYDYLLKPVKFEELLIKIAAACEHKMLSAKKF